MRWDSDDSQEYFEQVNEAQQKLRYLRNFDAGFGIACFIMAAIIFTQFAKMADILERELAEYKPLKISGTIKEEYKDVVAKFNAEDQHQVLVMTSAGQFGLNIQRASVIFHYDQEWSLAKMEQREGRAHRFGQKQTVLVYNLLAKGTVDYYVQKVLHKKKNLSNEVLGDTPITMGEIREMLNEEPY